MAARGLVERAEREKLERAKEGSSEDGRVGREESQELDLCLANFDAIGFDMDHTIVKYHLKVSPFNLPRE
tara:strand:- start:152 stop:361 length:210 start_codon:yes stop_codon:yes gene_type:complete